ILRIVAGGRIVRRELGFDRRVRVGVVHQCVEHLLDDGPTRRVGRGDRIERRDGRVDELEGFRGVAFDRGLLGRFGFVAPALATRFRPPATATRCGYAATAAAVVATAAAVAVVSAPTGTAGERGGRRDATRRLEEPAAGLFVVVFHPICRVLPYRHK